MNKMWNLRWLRFEGNWAESKAGFDSDFNRTGGLVIGCYTYIGSDTQSDLARTLTQAKLAFSPAPFSVLLLLLLLLMPT